MSDSGSSKGKQPREAEVAYYVRYGKLPTEADLKNETARERPHEHSQSMPGEAGRKRRRAKASDKRDISKDIQKVFLQKVHVREGGRTRSVPAIIGLIQKILVHAIKGDKRLRSLSYRIAADFGVFKITGETGLDFSKLTVDEQEIVRKSHKAIRKARYVVRYDDDLA